METPDILANVPNEGEEMDTPSESPTEQKPVVEEETPSTEGEEGDEESPENTPREEDDYKTRTGRRVQQLLKERAEERARVEELERQVREMSERNTPKEAEIPKEFSDLFGDDPEMWEKYSEMTRAQKESWKAELLEELRSEQSREEREAEEFASLYERAMDDLEASGKEFDRNELMKFISERPIWKTDGSPDFETALEILELKKPSKTSSARKALASVGNPTGGAPGKAYFTPDDFVGY